MHNITLHLVGFARFTKSLCKLQLMGYTVFRRKNAPGAEAENEPFTLFDFNATRGVD